MRGKDYKGFGEIHGLREWARLLEVNKDTLRYWLTTKGKTIEEFAEMNGITYEPQKVDDGRSRVNRMTQAKELLEQLFDRSGYDVESLSVDVAPGKRIMQVFYDGEKVGSYNLDSGGLNFMDGVSGINLLNYPVPNPKIHRGAEGWDVHHDTKVKLIDGILSKSKSL